METITLAQFLTWLVTGPGIGAALSALLAYTPYVGDWFAGLSYNAKRLVMMAACFAVPLAATGALLLLGEAVNTPETWFRALAAGALGYAASQVAHLKMRQMETRDASTQGG